MTTRAVSFTEYALLNRWALDCFSPSDFQKKRIEAVGNSVFQTLLQSKTNPYSNSENSSYLYRASKYLIHVPFKAAYVALVTFTFSRVGVVLNAAFTTLSYLRFRYNPNDENWEKTKNYAYAFFADLTCATLGALFTKVVVESAFYTLHFARIGTWMGTSKLPITTSALYGAGTLTTALLGIACLSAIQSPSIAPQFFARPQDRVGMYLSLILRQKLGLVNQKGGLLPFSKDDRLDYTERNRAFSFHGANFKNLCEFIQNAEWELLDKIKQCNQILPSDKQIPFQYPFDGESIACSLETPKHGSSSLGLASQEDIAINDLRNLGRKIKLLKDIFLTAQKLTLEDSIPMMILKAFIKVQPTTIKFDDTPSFINQAAYREYFGLGYRSHQSSEIPDFKEPPLDQSARLEKAFAWGTYQLDPINPTSKSRPATGLVDQFSYDASVNKWKFSQKETIPPFTTLFSLTPNSSYSEYKSVKRKYWIAIHPDRNKHPKADELFKCLSEIFEILDMRYK